MRSSKKRRITSVLALLLILSLLIALPSCDRKYDEEEVLAAAEELLHKTEILNTVYYGNGISYLFSGYSNGNYYEVDPLHLEALGFETIAELKALTESTFTVGYSQQIYATTLSSVSDDDGLYHMARYYQHYDALVPTEAVCIMVNTDYKGIFDNRLTYDYSTLKVEGSKKDRVYVTVDAEVKDKDGNSQITDIKITLIEESNGWRIDNPTWANYNTALDKYNELIGK